MGTTSEPFFKLHATYIFGFFTLFNIICVYTSINMFLCVCFFAYFMLVARVCVLMCSGVCDMSVYMVAARIGKWLADLR